MIKFHYDNKIPFGVISPFSPVGVLVKVEDICIATGSQLPGKYLLLFVFELFVFELTFLFIYFR